jgi:predicted O-linked N-acetylglucosamine transferase (SPINDLY family)
VQASWIGYIDTTGLEAIDYLLTDPHEVPVGEERFYAEELLRLPHGSMCYRAPEFAPEVAPLPARRHGRVTFGCFNNLAKMNERVVALWAKVLRAVPSSRLLLKSKPLGEASVADRYRAAFAAHGIGAERLTLDGFSPHPEMLAQYGELDIALGHFPYSGGLTSCEALWMGVPVVTRGGAWLVSRQTESFLRNIRLPELIAADEAGYVAVASGLAADPDRLTALRAGMRTRMVASPLCDAGRFARDVEAALRGMWRRWCGAA